MKTRILALLLAVIMCVSLLVACGDKKEATQTSGKESTTPVEKDPVIENVDTYVSGLDVEHGASLDGATFTYIGGGGQFAEKEEEIGNIENDALYKRQRELEDVLGIKWESITAAYAEGSGETGHAVVDYVKKAVMGNQKVYDLVYGTLVVTTQPLFNENCLENINDLTVTNLEEEWWPATLQDTHSIGGKLYFLTGPIMTTYYSDGQALLFNKAVADNYNIETPYESVLDGTWTFDKMFEVASAIPLNTSGAGEYRYGNPHGLSIMYAHGMTITKFDDNGTPYVESTLPAELVDLCDKFSVIMGDNNQSAHTKYEGSTYENVSDKYSYDSFDDMFADGGFLFYFAPTDAAAALREKDVEFGILPMPKGSASQKEYYSYADNWAARFCAIPKCTRDIAITDVVLEAMAALSLKHIRPAFYDKLLKGRSTHDTDSREMLDIIFKSKIYDIVDIYSLGNASSSGAFVRGIERSIAFDSSSLASEYQVGQMMAKRQIAKIMTMISK